MLDLVLWYFAMALTPWAALVAWKLIRAVGRFIEFGPSAALEAKPEQHRPRLCQEFGQTSSPPWVSHSPRW